MTKPRLPDGLGAIADKAQERLLSRASPPRVAIEKDKTGWRFSCPYNAADAERWQALLADAFGTRSGGMIDHFLNCIVDLVPEGKWNGEKGFWYPSEPDFNAVLAIVVSLKPESEAQAAYAAQLAALHLSAMKLGSHVVRYGDPRATAILAKTTRAYGDGIERMARIQGKVQPKTVNQTIQVVYVDGRSVKFTGGASPNGGQPHGADGSAAIPCAALPGPCEDRQSLPVSRREGQASVPHPRRKGRSAEG